MTSELLKKVVLLKQKIEDAKTAPILQKANRVEACVTEAVFVIEELVNEHEEARAVLDKLKNSLGHEVAVNGE